SRLADVEQDGVGPLLTDGNASLGEVLVPYDVLVVVLDVEDQAGIAAIRQGPVLHPALAVGRTQVENQPGPAPDRPDEHRVLDQQQVTVRGHDPSILDA